MINHVFVGLALRLGAPGKTRFSQMKAFRLAQINLRTPGANARQIRISYVGRGAGRIKRALGLAIWESLSVNGPAIGMLLVGIAVWGI